MTAEQKEALCVQALGLLNEQLEARIVHYRGDLETNAELDAITAQVVGEVRRMQGVASSLPRESRSVEEMEASHVELFTRLLKRVFREEDDGNLIAKNLGPIGKRLAKLFFESELHEKTRGDREKRIFHAEQGVYYVLQRYKNRIATELEGFDYASSVVKQATLDLLDRLQGDMKIAFLSHSSAELRRVMGAFTTVLAEFFHLHLPPRAEPMARLTIRNAGTAKQPGSVAYKVGPESFPAFRRHWERVLMEQMVNYCGDALLARMEEDGAEEVREETLKFFVDPHVYSETCEVLCEALYDYFCLEGFLDLPMDWRVGLGSAPLR